MKTRPKNKGKSKGSAFERQMAKRFSLWVSSGEVEAVFWRTAGSGSRATVRQRRGLSTPGHAGDLCATHALGIPIIDRIVFELKNYRNLGWSCLIHRRATKRGQDLYSFWLAAQAMAIANDKIPWLVAKQSGQPILIGVPISFVHALIGAGYNLSALTPMIGERLQCRDLDLVIYDLDRFLETIDPAWIETLPVKVEANRVR